MKMSDAKIGMRVKFTDEARKKLIVPSEEHRHGEIVRILNLTLSIRSDGAKKIKAYHSDFWQPE